MESRRGVLAVFVISMSFAALVVIMGLGFLAIQPPVVQAQQGSPMGFTKPAKWCVGKSSGEICIDYPGNLVPTSDRVIQLGSATLRWSDVQTASATINSLTVTNAIVFNSIIDSGDIADAAISTDKLRSAAVDSTKIVDSAVQTNKLATDAVTAAKIITDAVETAKLINGAVTVNKLADSAVETAKLATDAVTSAKILNGTIAATDLASNAVETAKILAGVVDTSKLAFNNIGIVDTGKLVCVMGDVNKRVGVCAPGTFDSATVKCDCQ